MLDPKFESLIDGVVLTSPAVGVQPAHPIFVVRKPAFVTTYFYALLNILYTQLQVFKCNLNPNPLHAFLRLSCQVIAPLLSLLLPRYQISAANKKGMPVSRDPAALVAKYSDPLVYTGSIRVRTGYEILRITSYLQQNLTKLRVPFFVLHGTADTVTDPRGLPETVR